MEADLLTWVKFVLHVELWVEEETSSGRLLGIKYPPTLLDVPFADPSGLVQACATVMADHAYMLMRQNTDNRWKLDGFPAAPGARYSRQWPGVSSTSTGGH